MKKLIFILMFATGCNEGCGDVKSVDHGHRDSKMSVHRRGDSCVMLFYTEAGDGAAAMAPIECPDGTK